MRDRTMLDVVTRICFSLLVVFLATIITRFLTRQILVERLGWDNAFTEMIFWGDDFMGDTSDGTGDDGEVLVDVDWEARYPFDEDIGGSKEVAGSSLIGRYISTVDMIKEKIDGYTKDLLLGHSQLTEMGMRYNELIGCGAMPMNEDGDTVILLENGYMTYREPAVQEKDLEVLADNVSRFSEYLDRQGIYFVYANAGSKVCPSDRQLPAGAVENTNENADGLINLLEDKRVNVLDYRPLQEAEFDDWYDSYYITDHHWKDTTGLWAARVLARYLNTHAGFGFDLRYLDPKMYSVETSEGYFLGGQGRTLLTTAVPLEPFDKVLPRFETDISIQIPTRGVDMRGAYPETLFREEFYNSIADYSARDFKEKMDAYNSAMWRNDALGTVQNHLTRDNPGKRLLMIQDSFGWYLSTFLATDIPEIDFLYLPAFDGSLEAYVEETRPDAVVLLLCEKNIRAIEPGDYAMHTHFFDLR